MEKHTNTKKTEQKTMKYIELFAGVGGFHYGIEQAYREKKTRESDNATSDLQNIESIGREWQYPVCVYSNEWDKYANSVYRRHYGECDDRDIREVPTTDIPDHDLLVGGFPCQAFSVAGKRGGFNDTRGTLFFEIARILKDKRPRYLLLENVKGLLSHDNGKTFQTILGVLSDLGYGVQWQVLNSKDFGVPQNRERVFIVGHLRGERRPEVFPLSGTDRADTFSRTVRAGGSQSATEKHAWDLVNEDMKIRRLTPTECERLQGFEDGWTQYGADGEKISDTQRYKMMGNAVTTNVITAIVEKLI